MKYLIIILLLICQSSFSKCIIKDCQQHKDTLLRIIDNQNNTLAVKKADLQEVKNSQNTYRTVGLIVLFGTFTALLIGVTKCRDCQNQ